MAKADIEWLAKEYNFGTFKEVEGPKTGLVKLVNHGPDPTFIKNVRPSCGCTDSSYTKEMLQPGDTAVVTFTYNPIGRPGPFEKTVRVFVGNEGIQQVIRIFGTVIGAPATLEANYPYMAGPLRLETLSLKAGEMRKGTARHFFVNAYNQSADTIRPVWDNRNEALELQLSPPEIAPGEIGTFGFYLRTNMDDEMGPAEYAVKIKADAADPHAEERVITVSAMIVPDTTLQTPEEANNGARIYLAPEFVDFGDVDTEKPLPFEFEILNEGKGVLEVAKVYATDEGIKIKKFPRRIKPGKRGKVNGVLDASSIKKGAFRLHVDVMSNDVLHPVRSANLVGVKL